MKTNTQSRRWFANRVTTAGRAPSGCSIDGITGSIGGGDDRSPDGAERLHMTARVTTPATVPASHNPAKRVNSALCSGIVAGLQTQHHQKREEEEAANHDPGEEREAEHGEPRHVQRSRRRGRPGLGGWIQEMFGSCGESDTLHSQMEERPLSVADVWNCLSNTTDIDRDGTGCGHRLG